MNAAAEEWGEDRLIEAVRSNRATTARGLIEPLMVSADAFVAGAPQHDDMTLVVVRIDLKSGAGLTALGSGPLWARRLSSVRSVELSSLTDLPAKPKALRP